MFKMNRCEVCGRVGDWNSYCSSACKQKAYRKRKEKKRLGKISGVSSMLIDLVGESAAMDAFDYLNSIDGKENQQAACNALEVILYAASQRIVNMIAESRD